MNRILDWEVKRELPIIKLFTLSFLHLQRLYQLMPVSFQPYQIPKNDNLFKPFMNYMSEIRKHTSLITGSVLLAVST